MKAPKKVFAMQRSRSGPAAQSWSFSLYPQHARIIRARESELNLHRSVVVQLLLEVEEKHGLVRQELLQRLAVVSAAQSRAGVSPASRVTPTQGQQFSFWVRPGV
jgi:hypothetical protein